MNYSFTYLLEETRITAAIVRVQEQLHFKEVILNDATRDCLLMFILVLGNKF